MRFTSASLEEPSSTQSGRFLRSWIVRIRGAVSGRVMTERPAFM